MKFIEHSFGDISEGLDNFIRCLIIVQNEEKILLKLSNTEYSNDSREKIKWEKDELVDLVERFVHQIP